jgi:hypothetical protein
MQDAARDDAILAGGVEGELGVHRPGEEIALAVGKHRNRCGELLGHRSDEELGGRRHRRAVLDVGHPITLRQQHLTVAAYLGYGPARRDSFLAVFALVV